MAKSCGDATQGWTQGPTQGWTGSCATGAMISKAHLLVHPEIPCHWASCLTHLHWHNEQDFVQYSYHVQNKKGISSSFPQILSTLKHYNLSASGLGGDSTID